MSPLPSLDHTLATPSTTRHLVQLNSSTSLLKSKSSLPNATMGSNPYTAQQCTKYYDVVVPAGSLQKAGIYQMQVSVNEWTPIIVRQTVMRAGQISIQNTAALIPTGYNNAPYGKTPISMVASDTFSFQIQLYDRYDNIFTNDNGLLPAAFMFNDTTIASTDYNVTVSNNRNGSYAVVVNVTKEGSFNQFLFLHQQRPRCPSDYVHNRQT